MRKAIFIDKDGTLIKDVPFNVDPTLVVAEPHVTEGLRKLSEDGFLLIVITNQSGLALGYFNHGQLEDLKNYLLSFFAQQGITIDGFYYCPHYTQGEVPEYVKECDCRKPKPGLILRAALDFGIDLESSWMIGDILNDVEAGNRAGCRSVLIDNGNETEWVTSPEERVPDFIATDLLTAADFILENSSSLVPRQKMISDDSNLEKL